MRNTEFPARLEGAMRPISHTSALIDHIVGKFGQLDLSYRLRVVREEIEGRIVFTTSFGLEDQVIAHAIFEDGLNIEVVTLDTGRLFPETYELWAATEQVYGRRIRGLSPEREGVEELVALQGINGFRSSIAARQACCQVRKVQPLRRALTDATAWITGVRAEQSAIRTAMAYVAFDEIQNLIKVNPLLDWTRDQVAEFIRKHGVPYNSLHDRGFPSIGCAPCTRAVRRGEPERAGRWWWEQEGKKECGLHLPQAEPCSADQRT